MEGLLDPSQILNGEETEECVRRVRAKLFRLAGKEWSELGIGLLKVCPSSHPALSLLELASDNCCVWSTLYTRLIHPCGFNLLYIVVVDRPVFVRFTVELFLEISE